MPTIQTLLFHLWLAFWPQYVPMPFTAVAGFPPLTLGVHNKTDNNTTSSATVAVAIGTPTAGSVIACAVKFSNSATFTSLADNVNTGNYFPGASLMREPNHNYIGGIYYHENSGASATTITLTYTPAETHGQLACAEIKGSKTAYALDSSFIAGQATTATNPNTGTTLTPYSTGRFLYDALLYDAGTLTAGINYTLLDNTGATASSALAPEYWIQTPATATTGAYTNATSSDYGTQMVALAPQQTGSCSASMIIDFSGGTNAASPTLANLQASTHGNAPQPNADRCIGCNGGNKPGAWTVVTTGVTYASAANAPLQTARNCSFYTAPGSSTLGLAAASGTTPEGNSVTFDTNSSTTTAFFCFMTDTPTSHAGTFDLGDISVNDNSDFVNIQINSNGATPTFQTEFKAGTVTAPTINWAASTWYGVRLTQVISGTDKAEYYSYSASACSGTPTLIGTHTDTSSSTLPANTIGLFGVSNSYAAGTHFYIGGVVVDYLYGSALVY